MQEMSELTKIIEGATLIPWPESQICLGCVHGYRLAETRGDAACVKGLTGGTNCPEHEELER